MQVVEALALLESRFRGVFRRVVDDPEFTKKYDLANGDTFDGSLFYLFTVQPSVNTFVIEAFLVVEDQPAGVLKRPEELTYPLMFEDIIERYTKTRKKPNPVLMETRSVDFGYLVTIKIEAVPPQAANRPIKFLLLREYQVLQYIWENYRAEYLANKCHTDQLIGFPMPFEFYNVDNAEYELSRDHGSGFDYYSPSGILEPMQRVILTSFTSESRPIKTTLSYMSLEKVGPSLDYLVELMATQGKRFSVSSALKVYDQLLCRLIILHKYSVVHCNINPGVLSFGTGEAVNVLYVNNFETGLVVSSTGGGTPLPLFDDRFVALSRVREKAAHFVADLESAFYVFLSLLVRSLPWDARLAAANEWPLSADAQLGTSDAQTPVSLRSEKCRTADEKELFWQSPNQIHWCMGSIDVEFKDSIYRSFTSDLLESIYNKVKDTIASCLRINPAGYSKDVFIQGSAPYNAYFGVRKIISSYFRFELRSNALKDPIWSAKIDMLKEGDEDDKRIGWDMSLWCWNYLDTSGISSPTVPTKGGFKSALRTS